MPTYEEIIERENVWRRRKMELERRMDTIFHLKPRGQQMREQREAREWQKISGKEPYIPTKER